MGRKSKSQIEKLNCNEVANIEKVNNESVETIESVTNMEGPSVSPQTIYYNPTPVESALKRSFEGNFEEYCYGGDRNSYLNLIYHLMQMIDKREIFYVPIIALPLTPEVRAYCPLAVEVAEDCEKGSTFIPMPAMDEWGEDCFPVYTRLEDLFRDYPGTLYREMTFMQIYEYFRKPSNISCITLRVGEDFLEFWGVDIDQILKMMYFPINVR